jgi:hypothetical protein
MSTQDTDRSRRIIRDNLNNNTVSVPDNNNLELTNNLTNNQVVVRNNNPINFTVQNNYSINNNPQPQNNSLLTQSNEPSTSSTQPNQNQNNLISPPEYNNTVNSYGISRNSIEQLLNEGFGDLFTKKDFLNDTKNMANVSQINEVPRIEITQVENNLSNNLIIINSTENDNLSQINSQIFNNDEILLIQNKNSHENKNYLKHKKSGLKDQLNQVFKGLRKIKSENNLFKNVFYKKIETKEFPLDPNNLLKIPQNLYDSMFNNTKNIIFWLREQNYNLNYDLKNKHKFFLELYSHIQWNKDTQENLFKLINSNNESNYIIKCLIKYYNISYETAKIEDTQLEFNKNFYEILKPLYSTSNLSSLSECTLREFYMLNDFDYLNMKYNKNLISVCLVNDLINGQHELKILWEYRRQNIINNSDKLLSLYEQYNENFNQFVNCFDSSTFDNYYNKLKQFDFIK